MSDNITRNSTAGGSVVATDDIAGVHFQRVKLVHGADGVNDGDVSAASAFPVRIGKATGAATASVVGLTNVVALAANTSRKSVSIFNNGGGGNIYYQSGAASVVAVASPIPIGSHVVLTTTETINLIADSASADVRLYEETYG
jgi:hypothetical protein